MSVALAVIGIVVAGVLISQRLETIIDPGRFAP
jgi:hypothetical protein